MVLLLSILAAEPCVSGPRVGQRPGPYSFVLSTGPERGKSHCYICETADRPAAIVFARSASGSLGKLAARIDAAMGKEKDLRSWVTVLAEDQSKLDAALKEWAKKHALRAVPVGVFEDAEGPPSYKLHKDADVTVLLSVKQKVVVNRAFRSGELDEKAIEALVAELPKILPPRK
ncbi:MAG: hypothetical protein K2W96_09545 [Gemmataceae bacterium]|nr:hypothetical protein [Gemmataceae bacterium]